jgi:hypothetical protein
MKIKSHRDHRLRSLLMMIARNYGQLRTIGQLRFAAPNTFCFDVYQTFYTRSQTLADGAAAGAEADDVDED